MPRASQISRGERLVGVHGAEESRPGVSSQRIYANSVPALQRTPKSPPPHHEPIVSNDQLSLGIPSIFQ